jgi:hypothetical protein
MFAVHELEPYLKAEAKERQEAARSKKNSGVNNDTTTGGKTREAAAKQLGVSNGTVAKAS